MMILTTRVSNWFGRHSNAVLGVMLVLSVVFVTALFAALFVLVEAGWAASTEERYDPESNGHVVDYEVACSGDFHQLNILKKSVDKLILRGYQPFGNVFETDSGPNQSCQPMVARGEPLDPDGDQQKE